MVVNDFFLVFLIVVVVGIVFSLGLRRSGPWPGVWWFFIMLFFGTWALGAWFRPLGPPVAGVFWLPYVIAALFIALLLAAATPMEPPPAGPTDPHDRSEAAAAALGAFFWLLLLLAVIAIVAHYWWPAVPADGSAV